MCVVCVLWNKGKLTAKEADNALVELIQETTDSDAILHAQETIERIERDKK